MARFAVPRGPKRYVTTYARFRGVDFSTDPALVDPSRSPFAPNLISDAGGMPEKRPGWRTLTTVRSPINGLYAWQFGQQEAIVIHGKDAIYLWQPGEEPYLMLEGVTDGRSQGFVMNGELYLLTGGEYLRIWRAEEGLARCRKVTENAYVPLTSIGRDPAGGGTAYEACNLLSSRRRNSFCCDGTSKNYVLDAQGLDDSHLECKLDGQVITGYGVDRQKGIVVFDEPPAKPQVAGRDNLEITFGVADQAEKIARCRVCGVYDGCAFVGNDPEEPAYDYRSAPGQPNYFPDLGYTRVGGDSAIMGYRRIGPYQAIIKETTSQEATVYLRQSGVLDGQTVYPVKQGVSGVGAISPYAFGNILDEPLFLSEEGVMGLCTSSVSEEKSVQNRSYFIDTALKQEAGLDQACAAQWRGCYVLAVGGRCYLLDGAQERAWRSQSMGDYLYECYHWENVPARCLLARGEDLFFGTEDGRLCRFNTDIDTMERYADDGQPVVCAWSTKADDDGSFAQYKTLRRRGSGLMIKPYLRSSVTVNLRTEQDFGQNIRYETMDIFDWEQLDLKRVGFSSNDAPRIVPFGQGLGRYITLQITVKNDGLYEGFGVYGIAKCYTKEGNIK